MTDLLLKSATPPLQLLPTTLAWLRRSRERRRWRRALMIGLLAGSLGLLTLAWQLNHHRYWRGTIFAVQTVDFNLLAHMLPTKLSLALKAEDSAELQRTLDSNFGLFGLVVTDCPHDRPHCPQQQIVHASRSSHKWRQQLTVDGLADHPYDVLRDPPPLKAEGRYLHPYDDQRQPTGYRNSGRVLGRVYYVRGIPPGVWENVGGRIRGIWAGFWRQPPETESLNSD